MQMYPSHLLPPSPINPVEPVPVQWPSGTVINWVGEYKPKEYKSIYANRTKLFKGHKREREREMRKKEIQDRVDTMDKRIEEWKAVSADLKRSGRPCVPSRQYSVSSFSPRQLGGRRFEGPWRGIWGWGKQQGRPQRDYRRAVANNRRRLRRRSSTTSRRFRSKHHTLLIVYYALFIGKRRQIGKPKQVVP